MKKLFNYLKRDRILFISFLASLLLIVFTVGIIFFVYSNLPPFIPLYNQLPWGEARLGTKNEIFIPVLIAFSILVLNLSASWFLYSKIPLLSRILSVTSLLVSFLLFLFISRSIQLVS